MRITEVQCTRCGHTFFEHEGHGDGPYPCEAEGCDCGDFGQPIDIPAVLPDEDVAWLERQIKLAGMHVRPHLLPPAAQQAIRERMRELAAERARHPGG